MGAFQAITMSAAGVSAPLLVSPPSSALGQPAPAYLLGLVATISPGAVLNYTVQITADRAPITGGNWNNHDILVNQTASGNSNITYPVTGVRLNVTSYTSGTVNLGVAYWP
jgi:hypothetical protein